MTYFEFHLVFILPILLLQLFLLWRRRASFTQVLLAIVTMSVVALVYTTPWDNYLVKNEVWWYGADRVLAVIGYVPVEEYAFFVLQTFLTGIFFYLLRTPVSVGFTPDRVSKQTGVIFWSILTLAGFSALGFERSFYFGLIFAWATPVILFQWIIGGDRLFARKELLLKAILIPTFYLSLADSVAIASGIWAISEDYTLGLKIGNLPVEEALFFLMTNVMLVFGLELTWGISEDPSLEGQTKMQRIKGSFSF